MFFFVDCDKGLSSSSNPPYRNKNDFYIKIKTFSYIGYMYIGTTLMVCRNALKDINETWYASCIYRLSD